MKRYFLSLVFVVGLILLLGQVSALSLSPGVHRFEYDERIGLEEEFVFSLTSRSSRDMAVEISVEGDLLNYLDFSEEDFVLGGGETVTVPVKLSVPPGLDEVGAKNSIITFARGVPESDQGGLMAVTYALGARVVVNFAYPGEYVTITTLEPVNVNQGEDTVINWEIQARGVETTVVVSQLSVLGESGEIVFEESFPDVAMQRNDVLTFSTNILSSSFKPGNYDVVLNTSSADNNESKHATLRIGEEDVELISFEPNNFSSGELGEFSYVVSSSWNSEFRNVYGVLEVLDVSTTTRSLTLTPFGEAKFDNQFIDLRGFEEGVYEGNLTIFFGEDKSKSFDVEIIVLDSSFNMGAITWILLISSVLSIALILLVLLFFRANKKVIKK